MIEKEKSWKDEIKDKWQWVNISCQLYKHVGQRELEILTQELSFAIYLSYKELHNEY